MKHQLKFGAVLLTIALLMTAAVAKTYTSKKGYSIAAPSGWTIQSNDSGNPEAIFIDKPINGIRPNINVVVTPSAKGQTLAQLKTQINSLYPRVFNSYKKLAQGNTKLGGVAGIYITAIHKMGSPKALLRMHQVFVLRKDSAYIFTCTSSDADYSKSDAAFKNALASVKWIKL